MRSLACFANVAFALALTMQSCAKLDAPRPDSSGGVPAPEIAGEDLDGAPFRLSDYRGKVVLLAFWGNWCPDCRAMYPHERALVKRMENRPFALIGVNSDKDKAVLKKAMEKEQITWRSFWDGGSTKGPISTKWQVRGWPTLYIIDHLGVVRVSYALGRSPGQEPLDEWIDRLVKEAEKKN